MCRQEREKLLPSRKRQHTLPLIIEGAGSGLPIAQAKSAS
jgi:hypothetical protein